MQKICFSWLSHRLFIYFKSAERLNKLFDLPTEMLVKPAVLLQKFSLEVKYSSQ